MLLSAVARKQKGEAHAVTNSSLSLSNFLPSRTGRDVKSNPSINVFRLDTLPTSSPSPPYNAHVVPEKKIQDAARPPRRTHSNQGLLDSTKPEGGGNPSRVNDAPTSAIQPEKLTARACLPAQYPGCVNGAPTIQPAVRSLRGPAYQLMHRTALLNERGNAR